MRGFSSTDLPSSHFLKILEVMFNKLDIGSSAGLILVNRKTIRSTKIRRSARFGSEESDMSALVEDLK